MKAILEFNLPDDACAFHDACNGTDWHDVVRGILARIREIVKYNETPEAAAEAIVSLREEIFEELGDRGLRLDD